MENLKVSFSIDQHDRKGNCLDNCILLHVGDMTILRFNTLKELKSFTEQVNTVVNDIEKKWGDL